MPKSIFAVEQGVPLPTDVRVDRKFFPWTELDTGDSFFVPDAKVTNMSAKASWAGRQYGKQFVCRSVKGGVRVWCLGDKDHGPKRSRHRNAEGELHRRASATPDDPNTDPTDGSPRR